MPKVAISTQIVTKKTMIEKGSCIDYKLDPSDPISRIRTSGNGKKGSYKLLDDKFEINVRAIPDYDKHYFINLKRNIANDQTFTAKLNEIGLMTESSYSQESKAFEIITQVAKSALSLAGVGTKSGVDIPASTDRL